MKGRGTYYKNGIEVPQGKFFIDGDAVELSASSINKIAGWFKATSLDGSTGKKACVTNGISAIVGGTGIAGMTLAAPSPGDLATIRIVSLTPGTVVVTCAAGVTVDGTNNTMTFDAANDTIMLAYKSPTQWEVVLNVSVALSSVS